MSYNVVYTEWNTGVCLQHRLREQVKKEQQFKTFSGNENTAKLPNDIVSKCSHYLMFQLVPSMTLPGLSYWLSRRIPADSDAKLELLLINCPTRRVIKALQILQVVHYKAFLFAIPTL